MRYSFTLNRRIFSLFRDTSLEQVRGGWEVRMTWVTADPLSWESELSGNTVQSHWLARDDKSLPTERSLESRHASWEQSKPIVMIFPFLILKLIILSSTFYSLILKALQTLGHPCGFLEKRVSYYIRAVCPGARFMTPSFGLISWSRAAPCVDCPFPNL